MSTAIRPPIRRKKRSDFWTAMVFLSPWLIGMLGLWLVPTALSLYFSFTDYTGIIWPPHWIGLQNFQNMVTGVDPDFWPSVRVTLWWVLVSVPFGLVVGLAMALLLNTQLKGIGIYRTLFYMPSLVPFVGGSLLFLWLFNPENGVVNAALG